MISMHDMFEPGIQAIHQGAELARWATESGMDFIGTPGAPTQRAGHVLDLTFSNVPFAQTTIRTDMHSGSDCLDISDTSYEITNWLCSRLYSVGY